MLEKLNKSNLIHFVRSLFTKSEYKRLLGCVLADPEKLPSLLRIVTGAREYTQKYYDKGVLTSPSPITIIIRITHRCNQRCIMCGQWGANGYLRKNDSDLTELTTSQIISFLDKMAYFRPFISFFGGEPLLRDDISEIISFANKKHLLTTMNSNCLLLSSKTEALVRSGLTFYKASLDGPPGVNEAVRGSCNSYHEAVEGLKRLMEERLRLRSPTPIIQMCTTITKENQHCLLDIAEIADDLGVDIWALLFGIFTTESLIKASDAISEADLGFKWKWWQGFVLERSGMDIEAIESQLREIKRRKWRFRYRQYPADTGAFDIGVHYNRPNRAHGGALCVLPWVRMQIMPNGDVALCEDTPDYVAGNILTEDPLQIWNGERYIRFRNHIKEKGVFPVCTRCSALYEIPHYQNEFLPPLEFNA